MKGKKLQPRIFYPTRLNLRFDAEIKNLAEKQKLKINHHHTSFTTNGKGTSLGRKHRRKKRPTQNKPKTIKKLVIGSYISIITLNVNGLNTSTNQTGRMDENTCMHFHLSHHFDSLKLYVIILYC